MKYVPKPVTRLVGRTMLKTSQHSPQLLFGAGIIGFGATVVLAARATLKVEEVLDDHQKKLMNVDSVVNNSEYTEKDRKQDKVILYTQTTTKLVKLYAPAIATGILSVAALTGSHHILNKRNAAVTAAYAALEKGFNEYRSRVRDELGVEKDREFRYGTTEVHETVEGKNGPEVKTKKVLGNAGGIYAKVFDRTNENFQKKPELNRIFLDSVQNFMNDRLHARGHVFLNEVYRALGYDHTEAGSVVGWKMGNGDDFIDFGEMRNASYDSQQYINDGAILLDFNVDGLIFDKLGG